MFRTSLFSDPWDIVRPRYWYPISSLEQSLMDFERMAENMMRSKFPLREGFMITPSSDDDFFDDLPVSSPVTEKETIESGETMKTEPSPEEAEPAQKEGKEGKRAYCNYSYSKSSVLDDKGQRVESIRRRYEDSNGRLKALHHRQIGDKTVISTWNRMKKEDKGEHTHRCNIGNPEEFEKLWSKTPFGEAEEKKALEHEESSSSKN